MWSEGSYPPDMEEVIKNVGAMALEGKFSSHQYRSNVVLSSYLIPAGGDTVSFALRSSHETFPRL